MALTLNGALDLQERRMFLDAANSEIQCHNNVTLDCSKVGTIEDGTLGMLVMIARAAARRGGRVRLVKVPQHLADALEAAKVRETFDLRPAQSRSRVR